MTRETESQETVQTAGDATQSRPTGRFARAAPPERRGRFWRETSGSPAPSRTPVLEAPPRPAESPTAPARPATFDRIAPPTRAAPLGARDGASKVALAGADPIALVVMLGLLALGGTSLAAGAPILAVLLVGLVSGAGLYDRDELLLRKTSLEEAPVLFAVAGLLTLCATLAGPWVFAAPLASGSLLVLWGGLTVALVALRTAARLAIQSRLPVERSILIGTPDDARRLERALGAGRSPSQLVARVPVERILVDNGSGTCEVNARALEAIVHWGAAQRIIISAEHASQDITLGLLRAAKGAGVRLSFLSVVLGAIGHGLVVDDVYGIPLVGVRRFRLRRRQRLAKRAFDLGVGIAIVIAVLPIMALLAVAIRVDSKGPVLFRQRRIGRDGRPFCIVKFRTMVPDAEALKAELRAENEADGLFKMDADPRITRAGRFLRKTSLDELPQLFNVLRGQMSLVGPRPLVPDEDDQIRGYDRRRLHLTPGMTGHWQILGSARVPLDEMLRIDYRYVTGWTLWEDVKILLRTVPYVIARRGQ